MKIINDHLSSAFLSFFPAGNTEDRRTGEEEEKNRERKECLRSGRKEERYKLCSSLGTVK